MLSYTTQSGRGATETDVFGFYIDDSSIGSYVHYKAIEGDHSQNLEPKGILVSQKM